MVIKEGSWWHEKTVVMAIFKEGKRDPGNFELVSPAWMSRRTVQQIFLKVISVYTKDQKVTVTTKGKSDLTNLMAFYDEMTGLLDKGDPWCSCLTLARFWQFPVVSF